MIEKILDKTKVVAEEVLKGVSTAYGEISKDPNKFFSDLNVKMMGSYDELKKIENENK